VIFFFVNKTNGEVFYVNNGLEGLMDGSVKIVEITGGAHRSRNA
jgi:hypothetical protein